MFESKLDFEKHLSTNHKKEEIKKTQYLSVTQYNQLNENIVEGNLSDMVHEEVNIDEVCVIAKDITQGITQIFSDKIHHKGISDNEILSSENVPELQNTSTLYVCEICTKTFIRVSNLNAHVITHTKDFYCYVCCNSYTSQFKLDRHMTEHGEEELLLRKDDPATIQCPFNCMELFHSKYLLFEHKKRHSNLIDYQCDICGKKFRYLRQFNTHKRKHEENTTCDLCQKKFSSSKTLKEHYRLHTGEMPFCCKICNKKFRCQSHFKHHELVHTKVKKYKCGQCSRMFSRSNYLKDHMRIHFNEKPFVCNYCNQCFIQANILKNHIAKKHRQCTVCSLCVGNAMQLRMHIWKNHSETQKNFKDTFVCFQDEQDLIGEQTIDSSQNVEDSLLKQFL